MSTSSAETGGPALLTCVVPTSFREHASVAAWYRDDAVLSATDHLCEYFTGAHEREILHGHYLRICTGSLDTFDQGLALRFQLVAVELVHNSN